MVCVGHFAQWHFRAGAKQHMPSIYTRAISFNTEDVVNLRFVITEAERATSSCKPPAKILSPQTKVCHYKKARSPDGPFGNRATAPVQILRRGSVSPEEFVKQAPPCLIYKA